jgi:hypothetical protein
LARDVSPEILFPTIIYYQFGIYAQYNSPKVHVTTSTKIHSQQQILQVLPMLCCTLVSCHAGICIAASRPVCCCSFNMTFPCQFPVSYAADIFLSYFTDALSPAFIHGAADLWSHPFTYGATAEQQLQLHHHLLQHPALQHHQLPVRSFL